MVLKITSLLLLRFFLVPSEFGELWDPSELWGDFLGLTSSSDLSSSETSMVGLAHGSLKGMSISSFGLELSDLLTLILGTGETKSSHGSVEFTNKLVFKGVLSILFLHKRSLNTSLSVLENKAEVVDSLILSLKMYKKLRKLTYGNSFGRPWNH